MKVEVTTIFIDKHTKKLHNVGEIIEITEERFAELKKAGKYVKEVKENKKAKAKAAETAVEETEKRG